MQSLARFLPSLATVKESKLSKHTIVDESLKYHEAQQAKLDELQKSIDVLKTEKETLLAEISHWRRCLDTPPQQAPGTVPCELPATHEPISYGPIANQAVEYSGMESSLDTTYSNPLVSEPAVGLELPAAPTSSAMPTDPFPGAALQIQQIDSYSLQHTTLPFSGAPMQDFPLLPPQHAAHASSYHQPTLDTATLMPHRTQQTYQDFLPYQSYDSLSLDSRRNQY